jgi:hypothetical protein
VNNRIRAIICGGVLREAFDLLENNCRAFAWELECERKTRWEPHKVRAQELFDQLLAMSQTKRLFLKSRKREEVMAAEGLLSRLERAITVLQAEVIVPLERLDAIPDAERQRGLAELKARKPYNPIIDEAASALVDAIAIQDGAVWDFCRAHPAPPVPPKTRVFIASSTEGLRIAEEIRRQMQVLPSVETIIWTDEGVFELMQTNLDSLEKVLDGCQFGIFVFTPDDTLVMRRRRRVTPRANVIFELGLFMGRHSRQRSFIVKPASGPDADNLLTEIIRWIRPVKISTITDLEGIIAADYDRTLPLEAALKPVCNDILKRIEDERAKASDS